MSNLVWSPYHSIMVAVLMFLRYAKCYAVLLMSQLRVKVGRTVLRLKKTD